MRKQRTFDAAQHQQGRFRREAVQPSERPRLSAKLGEFALAKQMARLDAQRRPDAD
jgi:hypothetical protein